MTTQPEALRLSDALDSWYNQTAIDDIDDAATELRRLHEVNQELLEIVRSAASHHCLEDDECGVCLSCRARAAIDKATGGEV